jgi:hypothetical protein
MAVTQFKTGSSFKNLTKYNDFLTSNSAYKPPAYESIASATGTGSSGTITFSSISGTYTSLQIRVTVRDTNASTGFGTLTLRLNNDSGTNYTRHNILCLDPGVDPAQSAISQNAFRIDCIPNANNAANVVGAAIYDIDDYASTTRNKTIRAFSGGNLNGSGSSVVNITSGLWLNTAAITRIDFLAQASFSTQTTISLYGIRG